MYRLHNGVITIPNAHSPNQAELGNTLKIFPSPLANQLPSIDVVLSNSESDAIPIEEVAYLVQHFAYNEKTRIENKAKFGALRDEKEMYKTKVMDNSRYKEDLRNEVTMLKEKSFAVHQTAREREEMQQHLSQKAAAMQNIEKSREQLNSQLNQVEERNRILRQRLAEKQARDGSNINSGIQGSQPMMVNQAVTNNQRDNRYSNQPSQPMMLPQQGGAQFQGNMPHPNQRMYADEGMGASAVSTNPKEIYDYIDHYNVGTNGNTGPYGGHSLTTSQVRPMPTQSMGQPARPQQGGGGYPHQQQIMRESGASDHQYVNNPLLKKVNF